MGTGYMFKCIKCEHEYKVSIGTGAFFPTEYEKCVKDIMRGKLGDEWKSIFLNNSAAVDAKKYLYLCKSCGNWKVDRSYSVHIYEYELFPKSLCLYSYNIDDTYKFVKSYYHKCSKCGKRMSKVNTNHDLSISLACPKCGKENYYHEILMWD